MAEELETGFGLIHFLFSQLLKTAVRLFRGQSVFKHCLREYDLIVISGSTMKLCLLWTKQRQLRPQGLMKKVRQIRLAAPLTFRLVFPRNVISIVQLILVLLAC